MWRYLYWTPSLASTKDQIVKDLNDVFGKDGWELMYVDSKGTYWFKRFVPRFEDDRAY